MSDEIRQARIDLAAAYRLAYMHGLSEGICNHLTLTVPGQPDKFLLIAHGTHWSQVTASNLLMVSLDGEVLEGEGVVEDTAFYIHAPIHRARPDLQCIMHTHQTQTLALAMIEGGAIEPINQNALRYYDRVARDDNYNGLAFDDQEGRRLAKSMQGKNILMMANHGVLIGASSVARAYDEIYYLERTAAAQILAMSTGRPLKLIPEEVCKETARQMMSDNMHRFANDHFNALKRVLDREQPDYKD
ncbi:MAG: aldolase [Rhodospirillaceae bacterium]|jgi:ribulose-5-phosphate 4-epimerase/fuculose-1-phosphate aldolase|nr:aldolase [Rhodospirillaceae bacterium]MBT3626746.1 aldolase [Rhodospirillaceae bacterium]MBT3927440.1 aldolase [Rhodospirillaceae bacterium]MBT4427835.1 aldolase [Rhodospirillaceae bacterium]MBT5037497.1 aldolase [Rhodospirillaceae bacterium]